MAVAAVVRMVVVAGGRGDRDRGDGQVAGPGGGTEEADVAEAKQAKSDERARRAHHLDQEASIGYPKDQRATIVALGLHRLHETVEHARQPRSMRGQIFKVKHLVQRRRKREAFYV